ncbi:MAG: hypothetical protein U0L18_00075 [Acutalibacteraceae bacterium]|jgi:hypothetical protein|nr:hypothetical protein [Acutalibacteraceae bacterium]
MLKIILFLIAFSFSAYITFRNSTIYIADKIGINQRFYPTHYIKLNNAMYKFLKTKSKEIPKFLYAEMFVVLVFGASFFVNVMVFVFSGLNGEIIWDLLVAEAWLAFINVLYLSAGYLFYKYVR